ncbi:MAG: hypothetical protein H3Z51_00035 [archaeon]|nr:hypothetical protein [archaeon]
MLKETYKLLADENCLLLLKMAQEGLRIGKVTPKSLGLTERRYYHRLKLLKKARLVVKEGSAYKATELGKIVFSTQVRILEEALANYNRIVAIERLRQVPGLTDSDIEKVSKSLLSEGSYLGEYFVKGGIPQVFTSFEELIAKVIEGIRHAEKNVKLATRYVDPRVIESLATAARRGIKVIVITDLRIILKRMGILQPLSDLKLFEPLLYPLKGTGVNFRYLALPFSFLIVDDNEAGVELVDPVFSENFIIGFLFRGRAVAGVLSKRFNELWLEATEDPVTVFRKGGLNEAPTRRGYQEGGPQKG